MGRFMDLLRYHWDECRFLCVGLDADYNKLPVHLKTESLTSALADFNCQIVDAVAEYCCAVKPNIAFYDSYGLAGWEALIRTNRYIREHYPQLPIIMDEKRADISNTTIGYIHALKEVLMGDAITVNPYLGRDALTPFLEEKDLGVFVLCHSSNPGAGEFQELQVEGEEHFYQKVARNVSQEWNYNHNCGLVVGATYPQLIPEVRSVAPELPLLIPGVGAQGGDLKQVVTNGLDRRGSGIIISVSRSIIYASAGKDFAAAALAETARLDREIKKCIAIEK